MGIDVAFQQDNNIVALVVERALVFARSAPLTMPALACLESMKPRILKSALPKGVLAVLPGTAGVSKEAIVERQRQFVRQVTQEVPDLFVAVVIVGDSVQAMAMRAVGRIFVLGRGNMATFREVDAGAAWLAQRMAMDEGGLTATVRELVGRVHGGAELETNLRS